MFTTNIYWMANCLGILSLLGFTLALSPVIANLANYQYGDRRILSIASKWGLLIAIFSSLSHGLLMTQKNNINFYDLKTYWSYAEGILTLNLLIILAFSFNEIKSNQKRFIYFVYVSLFLVACHLSTAILM